jgi:hypothetical protein
VVDAMAGSTQAPTPSTQSPVRDVRASVGRGRLDRAWLWVGVPLAIMVLCWRALPLEPRSGLGSSWEAGLHMAVHFGITFGNHVIFTYGPLGFLSAPTLWYSDTGTIAVLYNVLLRFALALALFFAARRSYGTLGGAIVAGAVVLVSEFALETVPFLVFCVWMVDRGAGAGAGAGADDAGAQGKRRRLMLMAAGGAFAGFQLLNKESLGIEMVVLALIVALSAQGRRRDQVLVTAAAIVLGLLFGWVASGQSIGLLPTYARNAGQIISGYASAMSFEDSGLAWQFLAGSLAFAFGLFAAWRMTAGGPTRRRWGIVALWVAFCFFEYKEGFVLHEPRHAAIFFVALMGGFLALRPELAHPLVGLAMTAVLVVFALAAQRGSFVAVADPAANAVSAIRQLIQVSSPSQSASIVAKGRREIEREYPIEQPTLNLLRGHTVHVEPFQAAVVWAYRLKWAPLPVFQSYAAYTTALDRLDASTLSSARAPQRILRNRDRDIDNRVQAFDQSLTTRTMLCRYRELLTTETWQVLGLGTNRCVGSPVSLGTPRAAWNQKVAVPPPPNAHSFVFVRIDGVQVGGAERLLGLLYRPAIRMVRLDGDQHRLIEGTAADGLVLRAPAAVDFTRPYKLAPDASTIAVTKAGTSRGPAKPVTFSFFAQSVSAGPRGALAHR